MQTMRDTVDAPQATIRLTPREAHWMHWIVGGIEDNDYRHWYEDELTEEQEANIERLYPGDIPYITEDDREATLNSFWLENALSIVKLQMPDSIDQAIEYGTASHADYRVGDRLQTQLEQALASLPPWIDRLNVEPEDAPEDTDPIEKIQRVLNSIKSL